MRRSRPYTVSVTNNPEVELQWEASVTPHRPARGMDPEEGGDVEDARLVLGATQIASARKLLGAFFASGDTSDARVESLVQDVLTRVLDAKGIQPDDDEFRDAAKLEDDGYEAAEDDAREERDREE